MISSVMPSLKYSLPASDVMLTKGRTTIEGVAAAAAAATPRRVPRRAGAPTRARRPRRRAPPPRRHAGAPRAPAAPFRAPGARADDARHQAPARVGGEAERQQVALHLLRRLVACVERFGRAPGRRSPRARAARRGGARRAARYVPCLMAAITTAAAAPVEGPPAGEHLVEHDAERPEVGCAGRRARRAPARGSCTRACRASLPAPVGGSVASISLAMPKSSSFTTPSPVSMTLDGLTSRCTTPARVRLRQPARDLQRRSPPPRRPRGPRHRRARCAAAASRRRRAAWR